jgi:hypothetical protein
MSLRIAPLGASSGLDLDVVGQHEVAEYTNPELARSAELESSSLAPSLQFQDVVPAGASADQKVFFDDRSRHADAAVGTEQPQTALPLLEAKLDALERNDRSGSLLILRITLQPFEGDLFLD